MKLVFDANAMIAYFEDEPGGKLADDLLAERSNTCFVHAVNLCEVYYGARRRKGEEAAQDVLRSIRSARLNVREDMDEDFWQDAGRIKSDLCKVSLADCFCATLANRIGGEVVTADHHEFDKLAELGVCKVTFIR